MTTPPPPDALAAAGAELARVCPADPYARPCTGGGHLCCNTPEPDATPCTDARCGNDVAPCTSRPCWIHEEER